jgi:two-component system, LytTR family, sensor kinase
MKSPFNINKRRYVLLSHVIFWVGYLSLSVFVFSGRENFNLALRLSLFQIIPQIAIAYFNMEILIPRFFIKKKYLHYAAYTLASFVALYLFYDFVMPQIYRAVMPPPTEEVRHWMRQSDGVPRKDFFNPMRKMRIVYALTQTLAIFFLSTAFKTSQIALRREKEASDLKSENLNSELKFLRSQINPHFLFNALNNIYSLSIVKSDKTPETILKLSEMLRYIIYDCNAEKVPLAKELNYIDNYISLQKLKMEFMDNVTVDFTKAQGDFLIAPMILIPFIENCFKHSSIEDQKNSWISMTLSTENDELNFYITNSLPAKSQSMDSASGIGLENVRRRLQLIYPDKHTLEITQKDMTFSVSLQIKLK